MKKSIILLMALAGSSIAEDTAATITLHEVTFTAPSALALQNAYATTADAASANMYLTGEAYYTNGNKGIKYSGIYLASDAGLKFNHTSNITVDYLYIGSGITMKAGTGTDKGQFNWSNTSESTRIQANKWIDINADYGTAIDISGMSHGALYLNTAGALTLKYATNQTSYTDYTLASGVDVYATITDVVNARTLLTGDFSNWEGSVYLMTADNKVYAGDDYTWEATAEGLKIVAAPIPEPTTATLSLLALAGLATRRRRK